MHLLDIENHHNTHPTTYLYLEEIGTNHYFNDNNILQEINKLKLKSYCEVLQHQKNDRVFFDFDKPPVLTKLVVYQNKKIHHYFNGVVIIHSMILI